MPQHNFNPYSVAGMDNLTSIQHQPKRGTKRKISQGPGDDDPQVAYQPHQVVPDNPSLYIRNPSNYSPQYTTEPSAVTKIGRPVRNSSPVKRNDGHRRHRKPSAMPPPAKPRVTSKPRVQQNDQHLSQSPHQRRDKKRLKLSVSSDGVASVAQPTRAPIPGPLSIPERLTKDVLNELTKEKLLDLIHQQAYYIAMLQKQTPEEARERLLKETTKLLSAQQGQVLGRECLKQELVEDCVHAGKPCNRQAQKNASQPYSDQTYQDEPAVSPSSHGTTESYDSEFLESTQEFAKTAQTPSKSNTIAYENPHKQKGSGQNPSYGLTPPTVATTQPDNDHHPGMSAMAGQTYDNLGGDFKNIFDDDVFASLDAPVFSDQQDGCTDVEATNNLTEQGGAVAVESSTFARLPSTAPTPATYHQPTMTPEANWNMPPNYSYNDTAYLPQADNSTYLHPTIQTTTTTENNQTAAAATYPTSGGGQDFYDPSLFQDYPDPAAEQIKATTGYFEALLAAGMPDPLTFDENGPISAGNEYGQYY